MMTISSAGSGGASSYVQMRGAHGGHGKPPDFSKIDTDGSGGLDKTELKAMLDKHASKTSGTDSTSGSTDSSQVDQLFSKLDTDGNGSISEAELKAGAPKKDGSEGSLASMGMSTAGFAGMMAPPPGPPPGPPPSGDGDGDSDDGTSATSSTSSTTSSSSSEKLKELLKALDTDQDGTISDKEVTAFSDKLKSMLTQVQQLANQQYQSVSDTSSSTSSSISSLSVMV